MAAYATPDDLAQRLPQSIRDQLLSEAADADGTAEDAAVAILAEAQGIIDAELASNGYVVPVAGLKATDPDMVTLRSHTLSIAKFLMLDRRGATAFDPGALRLFDAAMSWLKDPDLSNAQKNALGAVTTQTMVRAGYEGQVYGIRPDGTNPLKGL